MRTRLQLLGLLGTLLASTHATAEVAVAVGGGVEGFTRQAAREVASTAATWELRVQLCAERSLSLEVAYAGGASPELLTTTAETNLRANLRPGTWQPYALVGFGWRRYDARTRAASDNTVEFPLGLGLQVSHGAWRADARFTYRLGESFEIAGNTPVDTWSATFHLGRRL